jgi:radical SAM superfamily enzyme YgiQ (UPF0313 family)
MGCPHSCGFCVSGNFPPTRRPIDEVISEIDEVISQGYKEVYFADQTFNLNRERTIKLLKKIVEKKLKFGWSAFVRIDKLDEEMIKLFSNSGCHTLIFGIESGDYEFRKKYGKDISNLEILEKIDILRRHRIRSVGTFLVGLPGESLKTIKSTVNFAIDSGLDFASFNSVVPRPGTKITRTHRWHEFVVADQSNGEFLFEDIDDRLKDRSLPRIISWMNKRFYLRSSYIIKRFFSLRSINQLKVEAMQGIVLFLNHF